MRTLTILSITALLASGAAAPHARAATHPDVSKVAAEFTAAFSAKDPARIAALFAEDGVLMPANRPAVSGRAGIEAWFTQSFSRGVSGISLSPLDQGVSGDLAYDAGGYELTVDLPSGRSITVKGKYLVLLKKVGGQWKVAYDIDNTDAPPPPPPAP